MKFDLFWRVSGMIEDLPRGGVKAAGGSRSGRGRFPGGRVARNGWDWRSRRQGQWAGDCRQGNDAAACRRTPLPTLHQLAGEPSTATERRGYTEPRHGDGAAPTSESGQAVATTAERLDTIVGLRHPALQLGRNGANRAATWNVAGLVYKQTGWAGDCRQGNDAAACRGTRLAAYKGECAGDSARYTGDGRARMGCPSPRYTGRHEYRKLIFFAGRGGAAVV